MSLSETITLTDFSSTVGPRGSAEIPREIGAVRLIREIGRGGMGVVWQGRQQILGRDVAVKFLFTRVVDAVEAGLQQLLREARAAAAVQHPGLTAVHDAGVVGGIAYLVMDYVDGVSLADLLRHCGPLELGVSLHLMEAICDAVAALHDAGLVHRDLKPRNVLINPEGRVFVSDFGLACVCEPARQARVPSAAGTPPYMAPEVFAGDASPRSDVYALAVTLYELLTGVQPFGGNSFEDVRARQVAQSLPREPLLNRDVPLAVIELLERATHKSVMFRTKNARQLAEGLRAAVPDAGVWSRGGRELPRLVERCRRSALPTSEQGDGSTPTSTPELISVRAAIKRGSKQASAKPSSTPGSSAAASPVSAASQVEISTPCVTCGYDLRGLPTDGRCAECGTPVARSMNADRLAAADPEWLARVSRGLILGAMGIAGLVACIGLVFVSALALVALQSNPVAILLVNIAVPLLGVLSMGALLGGVVLVTALDPRLSLVRQPLGLRRLVRGAAIATLLVIATLQLLPAQSALVSKLCQWGLIVCYGFTLFAAYFYLARLAERVPDRLLARRTRHAAIGLLVSCCGLGITRMVGDLAGQGIAATIGSGGGEPLDVLRRLLVVVLTIGFSIALLAYVYEFCAMWFRYRSVLKTCLHESRRLSESV